MEVSDEESEREKIETEPQVIIRLALENCQLFKDQYGRGYTLVRIADHYESVSLESNRFKWYLTKLYYDNNGGRPPHRDSINSAIQLLQSKTQFGGPTVPLHIRVAWSSDKKSIFYDLTDENWNCVRIGKEGVELILGPDVNFPLFKRYNQTPQPIPEKKGYYYHNILDKFMSLTNVKENDDELLVKVWVISTFIPDITHTILNITGGQASAKTTFQKLVKQLVDPDKPENLLSINYNKMEFIQQISHRHVVLYDNLKYKVDWLPEEVCKAVTGGGTTKRELYTNEGDIIFDFKVCIGFNGINMVLNEPDVLRRSILIHLETIEDDDKIPESKIFARADEMRPYLLGYIFDVVSKAMPIKDSIRLASFPGIPDWAEWCEAISRAMGYEEMEFIEAYRRNIAKQNEQVIETNPFAKAISILFTDLLQNSNISRKFVFDELSGSYSISANAFLEELRAAAFRGGIDTNDKRFPASTNRISYLLNIINSNLKSHGLSVSLRMSRIAEDHRKGFHKNTSIVTLKSVNSSISGMLHGIPPESRDSRDSRDTFNIFDQTDQVEIQREENKENIETIPTTPTTLTTCQKCDYRAEPFYMKLHVCDGGQFVNRNLRYSQSVLVGHLQRSTRDKGN